MRRLCISICLVALAASSVRAQSTPIRLSESEFIARYLRMQPQLRMAASRITTAEANLFSARTLTNPFLNVQRESAGNETENTASVGFRFDLGGRSSRVQRARFQIRAARAGVERKRQVLLVDALRSYYTAVHMRDRAALLASRRSSLAATVKLLGLRAKAGENATYDHDRLRLELARYDAQLLQTRNQYTGARIALARMLNAPQQTFDVSGTLTLSSPAPLRSILPKIENRRADWRAAHALFAAANRQANAARRWWIPAFQVSAGIKTLSVGGATDTGYQLGLSVSLPLFDRNQAAKRRAVANQRRANATIAHLATTIRSNVRQAHATLTANLQQLHKLTADQLPLAQRLTKRAHIRYREGEKHIVELVDAERTLLGVRIRELQLRFRAKLAELTLQRALGGAR